MIPAPSDGFLRALTGSHTSYARCQLMDPTGTPGKTRTNLAINPSFKTSIGSWLDSDGGGGTSVSWVPTPSRSEPGALRMTRASNDGTYQAKSGQYAVQAGMQRTYSVYLMSPDVSAAFTIGLRFYKSDGTTLVHTATSAPVTVDGTWKRLSVYYAAPKGALKAEAFVTSTGSIAKNMNVYMDCLLLEEALTPKPWFSGDAADPENGAYDSLTWLGTPDASSSRIVTTSSATYHSGEYVGVVDGTLTLDGQRNIYRQATMTLTAQIPDFAFSLKRITPMSRLRLEKAVVLPDGTEEWVQLGILQVVDARLALTDSAIEVTAYDAGYLIDSDTLVLPYAPFDMDGNALTAVEAIQDLINSSVWEDVVLQIGEGVDTTTIPAPGTSFTGGKWEAINSLSRGIGCAVFVDSFGKWNIIKTDGTWDNVAAELASGEGGVLVDYEQNKTRRETYNAVPLRWDDANSGGLVFMVDADPASPTYWDGPYGHVPAAETSNPTITTEQQAIDAATTLLAEYKGKGLDIDFNAVHNPLLEPWDVVLIVVDGLVEGRYVLDSISMPLAGGEMSAAARRVRDS